MRERLVLTRLAPALAPILLASCGLHLPDFIPFTRKEMNVIHQYTRATDKVAEASLRILGVASAAGGVPVPGRQITWVAGGRLQLRVRLSSRAAGPLEELSVVLFRPGFIDLVPEGDPVALGRLAAGETASRSIAFPSARRPGPKGFVLAWRYREAGDFRVVHQPVQVWRPGVGVTSMRGVKDVSKPMAEVVEEGVVAPDFAADLGYSLVTSADGRLEVRLRLEGRVRSYLHGTFVSLAPDPALEARIVETRWNEDGNSRLVRLEVRTNGVRPGVYPLYLVLYYLANFQIRFQQIPLPVGVYDLTRARRGELVLTLPSGDRLMLEGMGPVEVPLSSELRGSLDSLSKAASVGLAESLRGARLTYDLRKAAPAQRRSRLLMGCHLLGRTAGLLALEKGARSRVVKETSINAALGESLIVRAEKLGHELGAELLVAAARQEKEPFRSGAMPMNRVKAPPPLKIPAEPLKSRTRNLPIRLAEVKGGLDVLPGPVYRFSKLPLDLAYDISGALKELGIVLDGPGAKKEKEKGKGREGKKKPGKGERERPPVYGLALVFLGTKGHRVKMYRSVMRSGTVHFRLDSFPSDTYRVSASFVEGRAVLGASTAVQVVYEGRPGPEAPADDLLAGLSPMEKRSLQSDHRFEKNVVVRTREGLKVRTRVHKLAHHELMKAGPVSRELVGVRYDDKLGFTRLSYRMRSRKPYSWKFQVGTHRVEGTLREQLRGRTPLETRASRFVANDPQLVSLDIKGKLGREFDMLETRVAGSPSEQYAKGTGVIVIVVMLVAPGSDEVPRIAREIEDRLYCLDVFALGYAVVRVSGLKGKPNPAAMVVELRRLPENLYPGVELWAGPAVFHIMKIELSNLFQNMLQVDTVILKWILGLSQLIYAQCMQIERDPPGYPQEYCFAWLPHPDTLHLQLLSRACAMMELPVGSDRVKKMLGVLINWIFQFLLGDQTGERRRDLSAIDPASKLHWLEALAILSRIFAKVLDKKILASPERITAILLRCVRAALLVVQMHRTFERALRPTSARRMRPFLHRVLLESKRRAAGKARRKR